MSWILRDTTKIWEGGAKTRGVRHELWWTVSANTEDSIAFRTRHSGLERASLLIETLICRGRQCQDCARTPFNCQTTPFLVWKMRSSLAFW